MKVGAGIAPRLVSAMQERNAGSAAGAAVEARAGLNLANSFNGMGWRAGRFCKLNLLGFFGLLAIRSSRVFGRACGAA
jgi:hypothetical protein